MLTVSKCQCMFPGLRLQPMPPCDPRSTDDVPMGRDRTSGADHQDQDDVIAHGGLRRAVDTEGHQHLHSPALSAADMEDERTSLSEALLEAIDVLNVVPYDGDSDGPMSMETDESPSQEAHPMLAFVQMQIKTIKVYVEAIRLRLELRHGNISLFSNAAILIAGLLVGDRSYQTPMTNTNTAGAAAAAQGHQSSCFIEPIVSIRCHMR